MGNQGTVDGGMRRPGYPRDLGWGQVPALRVSLWTLDRSRPSRIEVRDMLSYQSLMPAGAGAPRYENSVHRLMEGFRCRLWAPTHPLAGDKPQRYISPYDPRLSLFGRRWLVSPAGAGCHARCLPGAGARRKKLPRDLVD